MSGRLLIGLARCAVVVLMVAAILAIWLFVVLFTLVGWPVER